MRYAHDQSRTGLFYESGTYNTRSGLSHWVGGVTNHEADESMGVINSRYVGDGTRNVTQFLDGPQTFDNKLTFEVQDWRFMKFVLGSAVDGGSPSPYQHNYNESNNNMQTLEVPNQSLPSFTVEDIQRTLTGSNFGRRFTGGMVDTWTITAKEGEPITAELGYAAQGVTFFSGAATAITADATRPYMWNDLRVHIPSGTVINFVKEATFGGTNNLDKPHYLDGDRTIGVPIPGGRDHEVTLTINGDDSIAKVLYDQYFVGGSTFNMLVPISQSTGSEEAFLTYSGCKLVDMAAPTANIGTSEWTVTINPQTLFVQENDTVQYKNGFSGAGF